LHRSKHLLRIAPHKPASSAGRFRQTHSVKDRKARGLAQTGLGRIPNNRKIPWSEICAGIRRFPQDPAVERRESRLRYFAPFRLCRIDFRSIPELFGAQALGGTIASYVSHHDINVRVLGVVMLHGNPFQVGDEVLLHTFDQIARDAKVFKKYSQM